MPANYFLGILKCHPTHYSRPVGVSTGQVPLHSRKVRCHKGELCLVVTFRALEQASNADCALVPHVCGPEAHLSLLDILDAVRIACKDEKGGVPHVSCLDKSVGLLRLVGGGRHGDIVPTGALILVIEPEGGKIEGVFVAGDVRVEEVTPDKREGQWRNLLEGALWSTSSVTASRNSKLISQSTYKTTRSGRAVAFCPNAVCRWLAKAPTLTKL